MIAENPFIGHAHLELSDDLQIWRVAKHMIVYLLDNQKNTVFIVRILHQNIELKSQFMPAHVILT
jgi:plasmid stabilization system protein ParE